MADTNFPQYLGSAYQIPPELQAQLEEIQRRRTQPQAPMFTPEQQAERRAENERQYALGILGGMAGDQGLQQAGGQVLRQALANRQLKTSERGTTDPLTGQFTYSPEFLQQRDEATEAGIQNRIAQGRLNWDSQQQAERARADLAREGALNRAANRQPEALVAVVDPATGKSVLVQRSRAVGMTPAPTGGGNPGEDERKAAGWLAQSNLAWQQMREAMASDEKAARPTGKEKLITLIPGKAAEDVAYAQMSPARQRFVTAASSFAEAALRAATGAGVNEAEARQKIAELTPRWNESPEAMADKEARMRMYITSLEARAGRALPQAVQALPQGAPGGTTRNPMGPARNPKPASADGWSIVRE